MRRNLVFVPLAAGTLLLFGAAGPGERDPARAAEVSRLQQHFDSVDIELTSRNVANLNATQQARRATLAAWLRDYRGEAKFPKNDRFDTPTPFFRDSEGTLCAMAYLIDRSGRRDIVDKVAATRNNAYIRELADDPALIAWLDSSGLTVAEAARIQPAYGGDGGIVFGPDDDVESDIALAAIGLGSVSLATSAINVVKPSYLSGILGMLAGAAAIGTAASYRDDSRGADRVANAAIGLGALSIGAGVYGLLEARGRDENDDWDRDRRRRRGRSKASVALAPDVMVQRSEPRIGLRVVGSF